MNIEELFNIKSELVIDFRNYSLQELVNMDMIESGYDPTNETDVEKFWKERLE